MIFLKGFLPTSYWLLESEFYIVMVNTVIIIISITCIMLNYA